LLGISLYFSFIYVIAEHFSDSMTLLLRKIVLLLFLMSMCTSSMKDPMVAVLSYDLIPYEVSYFLIPLLPFQANKKRPHSHEGLSFFKAIYC